MDRSKILILNHYSLDVVCGTTVMFAELLRVAEAAAPEASFAYVAYDAYESPDEFRRALDREHRDASCVVGINAHLEVMWPFSEAAFAWAQDRGIAAFVHAHDYWPQHEEFLTALVGRFGVTTLASTPFIADTLERAGFASSIVEVGIPLPEAWTAVTVPDGPPVIASAGRLVPRKRMVDVVRAFVTAEVDPPATLYLRALRSNVFSSAADAELLREIETARAGSARVVIDQQPGARPDYADYAAYVCASSYEGFSMTVIEAAAAGCPPLMSDIAPHRRSAHIMFGERAADFLYPVGEVAALRALMRDELLTRRRKHYIDEHIVEIRSAIVARWSVRRLARELAALAKTSAARGGREPNSDVPDPII